MPEPLPPAFATVRMAQQRLSMSRQRVLTLIHDGTLASVKLGPRSYFIPIDSLNAYIERLHQQAAERQARRVPLTLTPRAREIVAELTGAALSPLSPRPGKRRAARSH